jgi:hypothetical protein
MGAKRRQWLETLATACERAISDLGPAEQSHPSLAGDIRDLLARTRDELDRGGRDPDPLDG